LDERVEQVRVTVGSASVYIAASEVSPLAGPSGAGIEERDVAGVLPSLDDVIEAIKEFGSKLAGAFEDTGAARAMVEFGCEFGLETGRLVAVLGKASAKSSLKVTLEWNKGDSTQ